MATLRDPLFTQDNAPVGELTFDPAAGMGSLRRGWEVGRIGSEANALAADEASLRASGKTAEAQSLRNQISTLQQRQAAYAPEVGRVQDINGAGDAMSWAAGQIGQGAASMVDPLAASVALGGAGQALSFAPGAVGAVGKGLRAFGAPAAAYGINQRQMKGEFYNEAVQDPELMARTSPQALNTTAELYGAGAGALDTVLPHMVGKQLTGAGLRQGLSRMGPGTKTALGMTGEGLTETAQGVGSQQVQGYLNPNRDTSGDLMENVNSFAGGAVGAGPFTAAGAVADTGYRRIGHEGERLGTKVGEMVDLAGEKLAPAAGSAVDKGRGWIGRGKSAIGQVIDLGKNEDGNFDVQKAVDSVKDSAADLGERFKVSLDEQRILGPIQMPEEISAAPVEAQQAWLEETDTKRTQLVGDRLAQLEENDPVAAGLLDRLSTTQDAAEQQAIVEEGAAHILKNNELEQLVSRAERAASTAGQAAVKAGGFIGKGAAAAGRGAVKFGKAVFDGAAEGARKKNAQTDEELRDFDARMGTAADIAETATTQALQGTRFAKSTAPAALVRKTVHRIAEAAPTFKKGGTLSLSTMADTLRVGLGANAPTVLSEMQAVAPAETHPLFEYLQKEVAALGTSAGRQAREQLRTNTANELMTLLPAAHRNVIMKMEATRRSDGSPSGMSRAWLLDTVEAAADGHVTRAERADLAALFGDNWQKALTVLNGTATERKTAEATTFAPGAETLDADNAVTMDDDGEVTQSEAVTDYDTAAAEKNVTKGSGPKIYGFASSINLRSNSGRSDPFANGAKLTVKERAQFELVNKQRAAEGLPPTTDPREENAKRPKLFRADDLLSDGTTRAMDKKIEDVKRRLKVDTTPERMAALMEEEGNGRAAAKVRELIADGSAKSTAALKERAESFFVNRAGGWNVGAKTAWDEMQGLGMQPGKVLQLYRDYLRQDAGDEKLSEEERQVLRHQSSMASKALLDMMDGTKGAKTYRLTAGQRREVQQDAEAYFKERHIVVAEQLSDRDSSRMVETELMDMARKTDKTLEYARGLMNDGKKDEANAAIDEANMLVFKSDLSHRADKALHIRAGDLVHWVRAQRNKSQEQGKAEENVKGLGKMDKDQAYLDDVLEGVAVVTASGMVESALPYKMNKFGKRESFANSVPPSLRLVNTTVYGLEAGKKMRAEGKPTKKKPSAEDYEEKVAREQDRDFFVADPLEGTDPEPTIERAPGAAMTEDERAEFAALGTAKERAEYKKNLALRKNGERFSDARDQVDIADATPLDFFGKQKPGQVPDDFADQRFQSKATGFDASKGDDAVGFESKLRAPKDAAKRGAAIVEALRTDTAKGIEALAARVRTAGREAFSRDQTDAVGGGHYAYPAAYALNADTLAGLDLSVAEAKQLADLRRDLAGNILKATDLNDKAKVDLTRMMAPEASRAKINLTNYRSVLAKASTPPAVATAPKAKPSTDSMLLADDYSSLKTKADVDKFLADAQARYKELQAISRSDEDREMTADELALYARTGSMFAKGATDDLAGYYDGTGHETTDTDVRAALAKAAPGVAAAGAPKSQRGQRGADWSDTGARKLSAMSSEIHNDLKRGGFAATHDSPIRHEGKFNWREHIGKGEGNAAFGAGTYLSTAEGVHKSYKEQFTAVVSNEFVPEEFQSSAQRNRGKLEDKISEALLDLRLMRDPGYGATADEIAAAERDLKSLSDQLTALEGPGNFGKGKSPTYHVSVSAMKAQLLNWDKPLSEQSSYVKKRLEGLKGQMAESIAADLDGGTYDARLAYVTEKMNGAPGSSIYGFLTDDLGSQAAASDYLQNLGILGHEYAASNGRDGKTPNYVIYDDSKITTNYVHFNRQGGNSRIATQAEMDEAKAYVRKVLGPQIKTEFKDITGYSGEWLDAEQAIQISTTAAPGVLHTAYHEALHGFFSKFVKSDPRVLETLKVLAENDAILNRVSALLAKYPAALDQLKSGEERLAYIFQFWAAGKLDLPYGKPRGVLQNLRKFFRRVLGLVTDTERAVGLLEAFHEGQLAEPSAAGRVIANVLAQGTMTLQARRKLDGISQWVAAKTMPAESILAVSESGTARELAKEFFTNPGDETAGKEAEGYLNARRRMATRYNNMLNGVVQGLGARDLNDVTTYLQDEAELADIPLAEHRAAVKGVRDLLSRFYRYMADEKGVDIGHVGDGKYYPVVWNTEALLNQRTEFTDMLMTNYPEQMAQGVASSHGKLTEAEVADRIWRALVDRGGVNDKLDAQRDDGVLTPFFASKEHRTLAWIKGEHRQPYLEKDLVGTLTRYFHQGARAAEYTERFGEEGEHLEAKLLQVRNELDEVSLKKMARKEFKDDAARRDWVGRQVRDVENAIGAMEGTLGKDVSPSVRKLNSWVTVYQNVRLLPLSLFVSFVDPLGMVARGATMKEAYDGFLRGMKEVVTNWGDMFRELPKEREGDKWDKLAEHVGSVDAALFSHHVSGEYSSVYMAPGSKKINDAMFKANGMEAWNRGMRVAATKSAVKFIERHSASPDVHSKRWLEELGLKPGSIPLDANGELMTSKQQLIASGMGKAKAEREIDAIHYAINRWVEGAILTPNAAQRPAWGSDPHYSMFFHLKQFSYSFHQTILKRAVSEMNHGNLAPMGAFVWYVPVMIAADITKGLIQGGGSLPPYMQGYDMGDWVMHGVERAGLLGVGTLGVDAGQDVASLAGPAVEQVIDAMREPIGRTVVDALPAHGLYAQALR